MITTKQLRIFGVFARQPFAEHTLKEIKVLSKERSNNALSIAMKQFKKEDLLLEKKVGKSSLYRLNFDNELVYYYLALANNNRINKLTKKAVKLIKQSVSKLTKFYSIVIFGSYAMQEQKKGSDIDIAVFIEEEKLRKNIERAIRSAEQKSVLPIDGHVISKDEFLKMLKVDYENLGKQIARKHLAVHNIQIFYDLLHEGIKNGFKL